MPHSSDILLSLIARLSGDAQLAALLPDGVWLDIAGSGKTRVVTIKQMHHETTDMFAACAFEQGVYLVKGVEYTKSALNVINAAKRIDALLNGQRWTIAGYTLMAAQYTEEVQYQEADSAQADARWQHCGAMYRVTVSPLT